jgi:hypothetical protein
VQQAQTTLYQIQSQSNWRALLAVPKLKIARRIAAAIIISIATAIEPSPDEGNRNRYRFFVMGVTIPDVSKNAMVALPTTSK